MGDRCGPFDYRVRDWVKKTVNGVWEKRVFMTLIPIWFSSIIATLAASSDGSASLALVAWSFIALFLVIVDAVWAYKAVKREEAAGGGDAEAAKSETSAEAGADANIEKLPASRAFPPEGEAQSTDEK
ncbi:hypothetical protein DL93DRAFT_2088919 [Clavulina sp. PMI_390]|nr:hypothetical protein DL93DRAFT_2088919 [Clavulina sp. PMI_390]